MLNGKKRIFRLLGELVCFALILCMALGTLPTIAEETDVADVSDGAESSTVTVIVASRDIPRGTRITNDYFKEIKVYKGNLPANAISDPQKVAASYATIDIFEGEYISSDMLSTKVVTKYNSDLVLKDIVRTKSDYVVVTDFIKANTGEDISALIQDLIDSNPNKMIIFPDGVYTVSNPICTSGASENSNSIILSDGAVIKASDDWKAKDGINSLICLGGSGHKNDIVSVGSYYTVSGGTLDGNGKAEGLRIVSGRESVVRNMCMVDVKVGITVSEGANNGSSDCDFEDLTIIGTGKSGSVGVLVEGYDNTFTNIRVYNMHKGFHCTSGGNLIKSIIVVNDDTSKGLAASNVGVHTSSSNWVSECYVENCATAYSFGAGSALSSCVAKWTSADYKNQTVATFNGQSLTMSGFRVEFLNGEGITTRLAAENGDNVDYDFIEGVAVKGTITDTSYEKYLMNNIPIIELP